MPQHRIARRFRQNLHDRKRCLEDMHGVSTLLCLFCGLIQLRAGRSLIDLVPVQGKLGREGGAAPGKEGRNLDHFCFRVDPFNEAKIRGHLQKHGICAGATEYRYGAEGEGPSIYLTDPEGNVVELKGPPGG